MCMKTTEGTAASLIAGRFLRSEGSSPKASKLLCFVTRFRRLHRFAYLARQGHCFHVDILLLRVRMPSPGSRVCNVIAPLIWLRLGGSPLAAARACSHCPVYAAGYSCARWQR